MKRNYRETVIDTLEALIEHRCHLFANVLNLASVGEMEEIMSAFEEGDVFDFELLHFESCKDKNIQLMISLLKNMEDTFFLMKQENNILTEEIRNADEI
ncbi:hypothetical protein [Sphingobacterium sp. 1.A.4]|uniref:hypothetical protein n=1 Tax=Sphingobacterium sp. 1.A.4 TaxID=2044603 RepID=UPI000C0C07C3|nr:hypothetical protein [Sphingobacterium sp. 1.A.4]